MNSLFEIASIKLWSLYNPNEAIFVKKRSGLFSFHGCQDMSIIFDGYGCFSKDNRHMYISIEEIYDSIELHYAVSIIFLNSEKSTSLTQLPKNDITHDIDYIRMIFNEFYIIEELEVHPSEHELTDRQKMDKYCTNNSAYLNNNTVTLEDDIPS